MAAFIPLLFMGGPIGRLLGEFAWTLAYAIMISAVVSLTLTPMICGRFIRRLPRARETWLDRRIEPFFEGLVRFYERSLTWALHHRWLMLLVTLTTFALTINLYILCPRASCRQATPVLSSATRARRPKFPSTRLKKFKRKSQLSSTATPPWTASPSPSAAHPALDRATRRASLCR